MLNHDRDEELSLFLEMRRREKEHRGESLSTGCDHVSMNGALTTAVSEALSATVSSQRYPLRRTAAENFLYSENEKSDYDWLLTPPGTPQFEKESHRSVMNQRQAPNSRPTVLKSRLGNCGEEMISGNNNNPQMSSLRRPSSSGSSRSTSRPSTPTRRSPTTTTSTTRPVTTTKGSTSRSSTPTSRAILTAARATTTSTAAPRTRASTSRSSTPTSRATLTAARATTSTTAPRTQTSTGSARSATPTRSKTQPPSAPSKPLSRPATPTHRSSIVSSKAPSRGTSPTPTVKPSRPWKPPETPGFSLEAPPNLRTTLPDRPVSARGRPGVASAPGSRSSSIERGSGSTIGGVGHARRQSCSPSRDRAPIGKTNGSARGRGKAINGGSSCVSMSPVAMGNKMVERVVNMRKLGPPRLTENVGRGTVKSNSAFNSLGYGRNLSKSSIDMALRHMDIRRGMTGNLRPLVTRKVPASSMYSVRSRSTSVTNSPVATSSTISSSELSVDNINILCLDGNGAENDDLLSERSYS